MYYDYNIYYKEWLKLLNYRISKNIDSDFNMMIWQLRKDHQINLLHYRSIYIHYKRGFSLHTVLKAANLKSRQQHFLNKLPNIMFANNSAYTALAYYSYMYV